jgi:O-antigen ligase
MEEPPTFAVSQETRFGLLRIRSSMEGGLGYFLVFCFGGLIALRRTRDVLGYPFWAAAAALLVALIFTGSRGAWIVFALMLIVTVGFTVIRSPIRFMAATAAGLVALPYVRDYFLTTSDRFGSFDYRAQLLKSTIPMVFEKPLFGWDSMLALFATGRLEHLRQGQGIIDIVNSYLGEALFHGIPGLVLFTGSLVCSLWAVLRRHNRDVERGELFQPEIAAFLSSMVIATSFLLVTISMVGYIPTYLWLLAALCSAFAALPEKEASGAASVVTSPNNLGVQRHKRLWRREAASISGNRRNDAR